MYLLTQAYSKLDKILLLKIILRHILQVVVSYIAAEAFANATQLDVHH